MALELGIGENALRRWVEQAEVEAGRDREGASKRSDGKSWWSCAARTGGRGGT
jgi:transposase-like protein